MKALAVFLNSFQVIWAIVEFNDKTIIMVQNKQYNKRLEREIDSYMNNM